MSEKQVTSTFSERLIEALKFQGITDHNQQVEKVAQACEVTARTAEKYLQATSCPAFLNNRFTTRFVNLCKALECGIEWLYCGEGQSPRGSRFLRYIETLTPWEQTKTFRFMVRLQNDCPKARRLSAMEQAGQISRAQLLLAM